MYEPIIEEDIISKLSDGAIAGLPFEVLRVYSGSDIGTIYNIAEAKLGSNGNAIMIRCGSETRVAGSTGAKFYQVSYQIEVILAGSTLKTKRNYTEPRNVYDLKEYCLNKLGGKQNEIDLSLRNYWYISGQDISVDDKIDLYLLNFEIKANYTLE